MPSGVRAFGCPRGAVLAAALVLAAACADGGKIEPADPGAAADAARPAELLPAAEIRDVPSLELEVGEPERRAGLVAREVRFTSFAWAGETWTHRATWLLPADREPACSGCAVVVDSAELAEAAARDGFPALAIEGGFPGERYGIDDEGALMAESLRVFFRDGDARAIGYGWLARVFLRGATAAGELPGGGAERVAIAGCSKRGVATWIAAAADRRVVGGMAACWSGANAAEWLRHKQERWGARRPGEQPGPAWLDAQRQIEMLAAPRGAELVALTDPAAFAADLAGKRMLIAVGTADPLYPVTGDRVYLDRLPDATRMALVPNVGHRVAPRHLHAWRHWLRAVFLGEASPPIRPRLEDAGDATGALRVALPAAEAPAPPGRLAVWFATDAEGGAFRDAAFEARALELDGGDWTATLPAPAPGERLGWFVSWSVEDPEAPVWRTSRFFEHVPQSTTGSPSRAVRSR